ncbi:hypothetical protein LFYK43_16000 [Ligilactobacillus salitolerans]|uniref:Uncharacterized protein n=1 Tax=Ligilactobacillus salitolerans TaxID=1808352 RepID=A0A401IUC7_9LACO|nr:hypothetical protein [Ligilactobacillus salitolerans]GBG95141.1 hypothetical protein LFYK43_16000 [Ligilactobacillus salitolerans]
MRSLYAQRLGFTKKGVTTIKNENNEIIYFITGRWGRVHDALSVYAVSGDLLAEIKQSSLGVFPKFDLYSNGKKVGSLRRYYGVSSEMLFVKGLNWFLLGNLNNFRYKIFSGRDLVMRTGDTYKNGQLCIKFDFYSQSDEPLCLCVAAILDHWATGGKKVKQKKHNLGWQTRPSFD